MASEIASNIERAAKESRCMEGRGYSVDVAPDGTWTVENPEGLWESSSEMEEFEDRLSRDSAACSQADSNLDEGLFYARAVETNDCIEDVTRLDLPDMPGESEYYRALESSASGQGGPAWMPYEKLAALTPEMEPAEWYRIKSICAEYGPVYGMMFDLPTE
jgi:hypothetical protein